MSDKFRLNRIYTSEDGNILWEDVTPLQHIIIEIEEKLYTDIESGTSVLIEHSNDGTNVSMVITARNKYKSILCYSIDPSKMLCVNL